METTFRKVQKAIWLKNQKCIHSDPYFFYFTKTQTESYSKILDIISNIFKVFYHTWSWKSQCSTTKIDVPFQTKNPHIINWSSAFTKTFILYILLALLNILFNRDLVYHFIREIRSRSILSFISLTERTNTRYLIFKTLM